MLRSFWRYSHLSLAIVSSVFLLLASVTGIILSAEPIVSKAQGYGISNFNDLTLAETLPKLREKYPDISRLEVDANRFVHITASGEDGKNIQVYVDPTTGRILGSVQKQQEFFQWVTAVHRSLFLKGIGRFFIFITSVILVFIALSGIILTIQRQRGVKRFFAKINKDGFSKYWHVVSGRILLLPILLIAITGAFLSLGTLQWIDTSTKGAKVEFDKIRSKPVKQPKDFDFFRATKLADVQSVEFPFSEDVEDYFTIKTKDKEVAINQITGETLAESKYPVATVMNAHSLKLHTGRGSILLALLLGIASLGIVFFIFSGFAITYHRLSGRIRNKFSLTQAETVILVGSENGATYGFAKNIHNLLLKKGFKSQLTSLNAYTNLPNCKNLVVFTSTYGLGDPPINGSKFLQLLASIPQSGTINYSVVGFGSKAYADFCKFAFEVNNALSEMEWAKPLLDIHTVNDKSGADFNVWAELWLTKQGISFEELPQKSTSKPKKLKQFNVLITSKVEKSIGAHFTLELNPRRKTKINSGDLLAIYPANDYRERLYSIGLIAQNLHLSIKLHRAGLGSEFLASLKTGGMLEGRIIKNPHFYFPKKAKSVVLISNGTGIAPFLGMIGCNSKKIDCRLYCGFKDKTSFNPYQQQLDESLATSKLAHLKVAYSREDEKQYVSTLIAQDGGFIGRTLKDGGTIMVCGSLSMQKDVFKVLDVMAQQTEGRDLAFYQARKQVLSDCY